MKMIRLVSIGLAGLALSTAAACKSAATSSPDAVAADDAAEVLAAPSICDRSAPPATGRAKQLRVLRAWLDGAEIGVLATEPRPTVDAALIARGGKLYGENCATCHGDKGDGTGPRGLTLADVPTDLTRGEYEIRSTESGSLPSDEDIFHTISHGVHGTAMVPWILLPERDRWALVAYLKTLSPAFSDDEAPPPVPVADPPTVTPDLLAKGNQIFHNAGCSSCHGDNAKGDGPAASALRRANGTPVKPRDLTGIHFHRGSDTTDIYRTITTGLDGSPMASFAKVLSDDDRWAVSAYVHSLTPQYQQGPEGFRCPPQQEPSADELIGMRSMLHGLQKD